MMDYERLGVFYLGREYDVEAARTSDTPVLYDSRDLVTHALIVGMTGSGKTGLGVTLIEEAAIDGVPAIVVDPKGDLTNLLLTFPALRPADFEPWVTEEEAARAGQSRAELAAREAARWTAGLQSWGQDPSRIARLRAAAEFTLFTPGSTAGTPISVLGSFAPPPAADPELLRERVQTAVSSLLVLAGIDSDPLKSREHILLSSVLTAAWEAGEHPDLATLIQRVQQPPMARIGVIDVDSFFPARDRFELAMRINAVLASPGFAAWTRGEPLDGASLLRTAAGRPRVAVMSLAHLSDTQRMFFVSMLLNAVIGWIRAQSGTSSLRALLYMDEIFGFFPPVANPPSKEPLLTLLKQGRAAGLGVVLATQNPVDLDYRGLSNIGTWWLGRLQTERDKQRLMDGLESAGKASFERAELDRLLSGLKSRVFLMRNVHDETPVVFQSRWALSYLRGPLTRDEIRRLTSEPAPGPSEGTPTTAAADIRRPVATTAGSGRPVLSPDVRQYFVRSLHAARSATAPYHEGTASTPDPPLLVPRIYGAASIRFVDRKHKVDMERTIALLTDVSDRAIPLDWSESEPAGFSPDALETDAPASAVFAPVPAPAAKSRQYAAWAKDLASWLVANQTLELLVSDATGEVSHPDESERDFRARLQQSAREVRDEAVDALRKRYAPKIARLEERLGRAKMARDREAEQASSQKVQTGISIGATLLGALLGRRTVSGALGRATTAARGVGRSMKESSDIARAEESIGALQQQRDRLEQELLAETAAIEARTDPGLQSLGRVVLKAKKSDVKVALVALVWVQPDRALS